MATVKKRKTVAAKAKRVHRGRGPDNPVDGTGHKHAQNNKEDAMIDALDRLAMFRSMEPVIQQAITANDPKTFLKEIQVASLLGIYDVARSSTSDISRLKAWQDLADRAGLKPPDRQAILNLNASDLTPAEMTAKIWELMQDGGDFEEVDQEADNGDASREEGGSSQDP